jgi:hypothetical protein
MRSFSLVSSTFWSCLERGGRRAPHRNAVQAPLPPRGCPEIYRARLDMYRAPSRNIRSSPLKCAERLFEMYRGALERSRVPVGRVSSEVSSALVLARPNSMAVALAQDSSLLRGRYKGTERSFEMSRGPLEMSRVPFGSVSSEVVGAPQRPIDIRAVALRRADGERSHGMHRAPL